MRSGLSILAGILALGLVGCGVPVTNSISASTMKTVTARNDSPLNDLVRAEGRPVRLNTSPEGEWLEADMSPAERVELEKLAKQGPGEPLSDAQLPMGMLRRVNLASAVVYPAPGQYHRAIWRYRDLRGMSGYRIHVQPSGVGSGKYIVAFYSSEGRLLTALPSWYKGRRGLQNFS